jgi:DnaB-like helicase C terminal domain
MLVGGGFLPGQMIVIGARPSMGKTALACQIADCAATHETGTAFFTLEMPDRSILLRMAAARAQAQRHGTYETYLTAIVAPTCDCDPPMLRLIGTAEPVATPCGTTAFTCNSPAMEPGADPAYCGVPVIPPMVTVTGNSGIFTADPVTLPVTPAGDVWPSPVA